MAATWGMKNDKLTSLHNQNADNIINNLLLFNENDEIKVVKSLLDTLLKGNLIYGQIALSNPLLTYI